MRTITSLAPLLAAPCLAICVATSHAPAQPARDLAAARSLSNAFQYVAAQTEPAVVHITTVEQVSSVRRDIFGRRFRSAPRTREGLGSGVIIDARDGLILTNHHVVAQGSELTVRLYDGREYQGTLLGSDPETDIAVVQIEAEDLKAAELGDSDDLAVGEWVIAIGSPFGLDQTVTAGIVSAKGRQLPGDALQNRFQEFIQTDASINPGNSGGPLLDLDGRVVGINTAIVSSTRQSAGLGFAVPAAIAEGVMDQILSDGMFERGWLGVTMDDVDPDQRRALGLRPEEGVVITSVVPESPADLAGLRTGDIVVRVDGREVVGGVNRLSNLIGLNEPGSRIRMEALRDGRTINTSANLITRAEGDLIALGAEAIPTLGLTVAPLNQTIAQELGLRRNRGVFVYDVAIGSPAENAGIQRNDLITEIDGRGVTDAEDVQQRVRLARRQVRLGIERGRLRGYVDIDLGL